MQTPVSVPPLSPGSSRIPHAPCSTGISKGILTAEPPKGSEQASTCLKKGDVRTASRADVAVSASPGCRECVILTLPGQPIGGLPRPRLNPLRLPSGELHASYRTRSDCSVEGVLFA
jgi:hypothetical protein